MPYHDVGLLYAWRLVGRHFQGDVAEVVHLAWLASRQSDGADAFLLAGA